MNWINLEVKLPEESGEYLISVNRETYKGQFTFTYVAHYDKEQNKWYKYNPFVDDSVGEEITDQVLGWVLNPSTYFGSN